MYTKLATFLEKGADVNAKDNDGQTAYDLIKNDEVKRILEQYGGKSGTLILPYPI